MSMSRSSGSKGGKWEAAIFYKKYNADSAAARKLTLKQFESAITEREKQKEIITIVICSTKLPLPVNGKGTRHHFILLEMEGGSYWVFEKTQTGILIQHSASQLPLLEEDALGSKRVQFRKIDDSEGHFKPVRGKNIETVISWLRDSRQVENCYNVNDANCIHFVRSLFIHICERRSKELNEVFNSFVGHAVGIHAGLGATVAGIVVGIVALIVALVNRNRN